MLNSRRGLVTALPILGLLASSCSAAPAATATPGAEATISPPSVIVAEGRLEPIRYAELALNTSGLVSEVLQEEGAAVKPGDRRALAVAAGREGGPASACRGGEGRRMAGPRRVAQ